MQDRDLYLRDRPSLAILKNPNETDLLDVANFEPTMRQPVKLPVDNGSRRRKLWDLASHCHCPVIGLCLSMTVLRKLAARVMEAPLPDDDYELHVNAVNECRRRGPLAELLNKELDQRYAAAIRKLNGVKTADALYRQWQAFVGRNETTAGLWACMTHPRCDPGTLERIYREVHMLQHQASAMSREKDEKFQTLQEEHARCLQDVEKSRMRYQQLQQEKASETEALNTELLRLRTDNAGKENTIRQLQAELASLRQHAEDLDSRIELAEQVRWLSDRNQELMQRIVEMRRATCMPEQYAPGTALGTSGSNRATEPGAEGESRNATSISRTPQGGTVAASGATASGPENEAKGQPAGARATAGRHNGPLTTGFADAGTVPAGADMAADATAAQPDASPDGLDSRAVLCVGGRHAAISIYRRIVEKKGGRFIHHDGGREDSVHRLDASLAAADLVICQAGCISHSAYWLVKDHCKRTGKRCVYVDKPSASAFARGLEQSVQENGTIPLVDVSEA
ncbi:MAG: DUF2325 domain-containing protein [Lautropia sp.]|nr:DUF2325 domain-containing protein [Lautropia sp.]